MRKSSLLPIFASFSILCLTPCLLHPFDKRPLNNDLLSVSFPTDQHGWACGRWGTVLHTENGGLTWSRQRTPTNYTLTSICFVDPKNGWAVGEGGTIIRTEDGGVSWVLQESPVNSILMGVYFANRRAGWVVGERTTILHTGDGGQTWGGQFSDGDFILTSVSFCDSQTGWAVGEYGFIYHTADGGRLWTKQAGDFAYTEDLSDIIGGNFLFDVLAVDRMTAWAVGIDGYVIRTGDGGNTWQQISGNFPQTQLFSIASNRHGTLIVSGNASLLASNDGGNTFRACKPEPPITYGWLYGVCSRGTEGFVAVGREGWIYVSDGEGISWKRVN
jgi:photosystem II stability/assembly factor-like uncharacterized protein